MDQGSILMGSWRRQGKYARNVLIRTILTLFSPSDTLQFQPSTEERENPKPKQEKKEY